MKFRAFRCEGPFLFRGLASCSPSIGSQDGGPFSSTCFARAGWQAARTCCVFPARAARVAHRHPRAPGPSPTGSLAMNDRRPIRKVGHGARSLAASRCSPARFSRGLPRALAPRGLSELQRPGPGGGAGPSTDGQGALTREGHGAYFPIEPGSKHADNQCGECHEDPTSFSSFTCVSCHAHDEDAAMKRHEYITGFQWSSNACFNCHPRGWEAPILPADHSLKYFPIQSGSHNTLLCIDCHADSSTSKAFICTSCHGDSAAAAQHSSVAGYEWSDAGCYRCHAQD